MEPSIAKHLGDWLVWFAAETESFPLRFERRSQWLAEIEAAAAALHTYARQQEVENATSEQIEAAQKAIYWVANNLTDLWS